MRRVQPSSAFTSNAACVNAPELTKETGTIESAAAEVPNCRMRFSNLVGLGVSKVESELGNRSRRPSFEKG